MISTYLIILFEPESGGLEINQMLLCNNSDDFVEERVSFGVVLAIPDV